MYTCIKGLKKYQSILDVRETEKAIKQIKDYFQINLIKELNLTRVTAPLLVKAGTGINDDLTGVERPVSFAIKDMNHTRGEIVQSLAKWKRLTLAKLEVGPGEGIYTDMNAIRPDEKLSNLHSLYVDQWDWERVIIAPERNLEFLKKIVRRIYRALLKTEEVIAASYPILKPVLPREICFLHAQELADKFPDLSPEERETAVCRDMGAVFIIGIGAPLKNGRPHDKRAPDYDDWTTPTEIGTGLNGDIIVWHQILERSLELSSMGIRVDPEALEIQLDLNGSRNRRELFFHQKLLKGELPLSIGGGIGQSRLCMFLLKKAHIGEVQASIWPDSVLEECRRQKIFLL